MPSIPPSADANQGRTTAPPAICPVCGEPGDGFQRLDRLLHHAQYLCAGGHIWTAKWMEDA